MINFINALCDPLDLNIFESISNKGYYIYDSVLILFILTIFLNWFINLNELLIYYKFELSY